MNASNDVIVSNGRKGCIRIADTDLHTFATPANGFEGRCEAIYIEQDAVFTSLTSNSVGFVGPTIPAGTWIFGTHAAAQLASGVIHAYPAA